MDKIPFYRSQEKNIVLFVLISLVFILYWFANINVKKEILNEELESHYSGRIVGKYIDCKNHRQPFLILSKDSILPIFLEYYDNIQIGDSIEKKRGSYYFIIYKHDKVIKFNIKDKLIK